MSVDERAAFEAIDPKKDVDGVTKDSFAYMAFGLPGYASCTPAAIVRLLDAYDVPLAGQSEGAEKPVPALHQEWSI